MRRITKWLSVTAASLFGLGLAGFLGSYFAYGGQYVVPATTLDDPSLPGRNIAGYRYHLEVFGLPTRPVVIVLHDGPGADYRSLLTLKPLSDDYQLVFYDQRGTGLSPRVPDEQLSLAQSIEDLHDIVGALSMHAPVRLIGQGWGAMLAAAYLDRYPETVSHAVLAEPPFLTAEAGNHWFETVRHGEPPVSWALLGGAWRSLIESLYVYGPDADARRDFFTHELATLDAADSPFSAYHCDGDAKSVAPLIWRSGSRASRVIQNKEREGGQFAHDMVSPRAKRFPHKVLLLAGSCDTVSGPAVQRQNLSLFASAELAVIKDAGHAVLEENPEASLSVLRRYLAEGHSAIVASE
jgi:proline iminopeptidase